MNRLGIPGGSTTMASAPGVFEAPDQQLALDQNRLRVRRHQPRP